MTIDLEALVDLHPDLPEEVDGVMAFGAAVALERRHETGALLAIDLAGKPIEEQLIWRKRGAARADKIDERRATEDGAEGIALGIVGHHRPRWRLVRRLQSRRGERADWLFAADPNGAWVVLEISGTDAAAIGPRENKKRAQAASSTVARRAAACVVRFIEPRASLWASDPDEPC